MKNITKAILGGIGVLAAGNIIYNKGRSDGVEDCKNTICRAIAERSLTEKASKKTKKEIKEESK